MTSARVALLKRVLLDFLLISAEQKLDDTKIVH